MAKTNDKNTNPNDPDTPPKNGIPPVPTMIKALVRHTSYLGTIGDVIDLSADQARDLQMQGLIDTHPAAIALHWQG